MMQGLDVYTSQYLSNGTCEAGLTEANVLCMGHELHDRKWFETEKPLFSLWYQVVKLDF